MNEMLGVKGHKDCCIYFHSENGQEDCKTAAARASVLEVCGNCVTRTAAMRPLHQGRQPGRHCNAVWRKREMLRESDNEMQCMPFKSVVIVS